MSLQSPKRRQRVVAVIAGLAVAVVAVARCGGTGIPAPDLEPGTRPTETTCLPLRQTMPRFFALIERDDQPLRGLRDAVVRLSTGEAADENIIGRLLSGAVRGLQRFTKDPDEGDETQCVSPIPLVEGEPAPLCAVEAVAGEPCENRICAVRRGLDSGIRQREAAEALKALQPLLVKLIGYLGNTGPGADGREHLEVISVLNATSAPEFEGICGPENLTVVVDRLLVSFRSYPGCGERCPADRALSLLRRVVEDPALSGFLSGYEGGESLGEAGRNSFQKLAAVLLSNLGSLSAEQDPYETAVAPLLGTVRTFLGRDPAKNASLLAAVDELSALLREILTPVDGDRRFFVALTGVAKCLAVVDAQQELVGGIYDLLVREGGEGGDGLDLAELLAALEALSNADRNGAVIGLLHVVLASTANDPEALENVRSFLHDLVTIENARSALPALQVMVQEGVLEEAIALLDGIVYGCKPPGTR